MPISIQSVCERAASFLDANSITQFGAANGDFYIFDNDYKPAINYAIDRIVEIITGRLGSNKFSEEALRELTQVWCFQTSSYSRVAIPNTVWSIVSVMHEPITVPASPTINVVAADVSQYRPDVYYVSSLNTAKRLSSEKYSDGRNSVFSPAFVGETRNLGQAAYKQMTGYNSSVEIPYDNLIGAFVLGENLTDTTSGATAVILADTGTVLTVNFIIGAFADNDALLGASGATADVNTPLGYPITVPMEIEISPAKNKKIVGLEIVKYPTKATVQGGYLDFPATLTDIIVNLTLLGMARKQGDGTTLFSVSMNDVIQEVKNFG